MDVKLYTFSKKDNSTKQPTGGTTFDCDIKLASSITTPTLQLKLASTVTNPSVYNYAYIPSFSRYYFIGDWTYYQGLWTADLKCDVLASFKTDIGNNTMYVLRSASDYNLDVVDTFYPTMYDVNASAKTPVNANVLLSSLTSSETETPTTPFHTLREDGYYYVKIIDYENENGLSVYVMNHTNFVKLIDSLQDIDYSSWADVSEGVARQLANPLQYIVSTYWLPFKIPGQNTPSRTLYLGYFGIPNINCGKVQQPGFRLSFPIELASHPQVARGNYLNQKPYTSATFIYEPFGSFDLATGDLAGLTNVYVTVDVDIWTGTATLKLGRTSGADNILHVNANYGVPIQVAQVTTSVSGTFARNIGSYFNLGSMNQSDSGLGRIIGNALSPDTRASTNGTEGAFLPFIFIPIIRYVFYSVVEENLDHWGRPLCEEVTLNTLSGYIQCAEGDIDIACLDNERTEISRYLTEGFFME